jgi:hypothetical protein
MAARLRHLEEQALLPPGRREEDVLVLRGRRG